MVPLPTEHTEITKTLYFRVTVRRSHQPKIINTVKYSMMTSSNGNIFRVTGPLCREFTCHRWIPLTKASDAELWCFLWFASWINGWVNNSDAGDLRCYRTHFDVIVIPWGFVIMFGEKQNDGQQFSCSDCIHQGRPEIMGSWIIWYVSPAP